MAIVTQMHFLKMELIGLGLLEILGNIVATVVVIGIIGWLITNLFGGNKDDACERCYYLENENNRLRTLLEGVQLGNQTRVVNHHYRHAETSEEFFDDEENDF